MKKIIISIVSILVGVILAVILVFVFYDKKTEVYIESSYNDVKLSLGKTKVKEINNTRPSSYDIRRKYSMSNPYEFYESNIKTSEYYNSKLTFYDDNDNVYGYLIKDDVAFKYYITDDEIWLSTMATDYNGNETYDMILCDIDDFITSKTKGTDYAKFFCQWFIFNNSSIVKYDDIIELYKCMDQDMVKIEDDAIYLKGYDVSMNLSNDYIVKIVNVDGIGYGYAIEA
jgi:uncharacterized protein YxeA